MAQLPNVEFRQMIPLLRDSEFYEDELPRKISWPEYNESQIKDAKETLTFIRETVDSCERSELKGRIGRPLTDPKMLAKAILICEELGFTERESQGWLDILGPFVEINQHLDDRVIGEAYDNYQVLYILKQVFDRSKTTDGKLAGDGTGIETSRKQNYESTKKTGAYILTSPLDEFSDYF